MSEGTAAAPSPRLLRCCNAHCSQTFTNHDELDDHYQLFPQCYYASTHRRITSAASERDPIGVSFADMSYASSHEIPSDAEVSSDYYGSPHRFDTAGTARITTPPPVAVDFPPPDDDEQLASPLASPERPSFSNYYGASPPRYPSVPDAIPLEVFLRRHNYSQPLRSNTREFQFLSQLYHIVISGRMPLYYFDVILEWAQSGAESGVLSSTSSLPRREAYSKRLLGLYGMNNYSRHSAAPEVPYHIAPVLLENPVTSRLVNGLYPVADGEGQDPDTDEDSPDDDSDDSHAPPPVGVKNQVTVFRFSFRAMLIDLLSDIELFSDESNLVYNRTSDPQDRFKPFVISDCTPLHEIPTGSYYQLLARDPGYQSGARFLLPIVIYGDSTLVDKMGKYSVEPWIFSLGIFTEKLRRTNSNCWRPLGLRPPLSVPNKPEANIRNGHRCLEPLLSEIKECMTNGVIVDLMLGGHVKENMTVVPVPFFVIQDGKSRDFITGRFSGTKNVKRISVYCTCPQQKADEVDLECTPIKKQYIYYYARCCSNQYRLCDDIRLRHDFDRASAHAHFDELAHARVDTDDAILKYCRQRLKDLSQHESYSPFNDLFDDRADVYGLFQACPVDLMHAFLLGISKYALETIFHFFLPSTRVVMDDYVIRKIGKARQSSRRRFPRANFVKTFSHLKNVTAEEWDGIAFTLFLYLQTHNGTDALAQDLVSRKAHPDRASAVCRVGLIVRTLSEMLCFVAWSRHGPFGFAGDSIGSGGMLDLIKHRVLLMLRNIQLYVPRVTYDSKKKQYVTKKLGYKIQKFHDMKWLVPFIARFGSPWNFDAGAGESLLKLYAKQPGATAQKTSEATLSIQLFRRLQEAEALHSYARKTGVAFIIDRHKRTKRRKEPAPALLTASDNDSSPTDDEDSSAGSGGVPASNFSGETRVRLWQMRVSNGPDGGMVQELEHLWRQKFEEALNPLVARTVFAHACDLLREDCTEARLTGFAEMTVRPTPPASGCDANLFIRSHPSYACGNHDGVSKHWYDWVLVNWELDPSAVVPERVSPAVASLPRSPNPFLAPGLLETSDTSAPNVEFLLEHNWPGTFLPSLYPAKVLAIFSAETGPGDGTYNPAGHYLLVHSCDTPQPGDDHQPAALLLKRWKMEYRDNGRPKYRVIPAGSVRGSIFVMDPYHDQPFVRETQRHDPFIYGAFERADVWAKQFLYSTHFAALP